MKRALSSRRGFGKTALVGGFYLLASCGGGGGGKRKRKDPDSDSFPTVSIIRDFPNDGTVKYTLMGHDADGQVIEIQVKYNDENVEVYRTDNITIYKPVSQKTNHLEVSVMDNEGAATKSEDIFEIPTKNDAYDHIKQMLDNARGFSHYLSDASEKVPIYQRILQIPEDRKILVDFLITRNDERFSVINYVSLDDNLEEEIHHQKSVHGFFIDNLYLFRLPVDEITKRMQDFIKSGYTTKFEN